MLFISGFFLRSGALLLEFYLYSEGVCAFLKFFLFLFSTERKKTSEENILLCKILVCRCVRLFYLLFDFRMPFIYTVFSIHAFFAILCSFKFGAVLIFSCFTHLPFSSLLALLFRWYVLHESILVDVIAVLLVQIKLKLLFSISVFIMIL